LKLLVTESPWNMTFFDTDGNPVLVELPDMGDGPSGSLAMHLGPPLPGNGQQSTLPPVREGIPATPPLRDSGWVHATAVESSGYEGDAYLATIATSDPDRKLELVAAAEADGVISITVQPASADGVQVLGIGFVAEQAERFVGFGERSNTVNQSGWALEHYLLPHPLAPVIARLRRADRQRRDQLPPRRLRSPRRLEYGSRNGGAAVPRFRGTHAG
jgi:hypothetical protein